MSFNLTNPIHQRAIRTTIAVFIAVLLVHWLKIPHGNWVTVSAFIVSQDTIGNTVWKAKGRVLGTLSGAIAAVMLYGVIVQYHRLVLIIAFAAIFPYLYLRPSMENYGYAKFFQQIALICFLSIIGENPSAEVMEWRAADIAIGCVVGVFVALVVFPTWAYPRWQKAQQTAWQDLQTWFEAIVAEYQSHGFDQHRLQQLSRTTQSSVFKLDEVLFSRQQEFLVKRRDYGNKTVLMQVQARVLQSHERLYQTLLYLMHVAEYSKPVGQPGILPPESQEMVQQIQSAFAEIGAMIGTRHPSQFPLIRHYQLPDTLQNSLEPVNLEAFTLKEFNVPIQLNQVAEAIAEFTASRNELLAKLIPIRPVPPAP